MAKWVCLQCCALVLKDKASRIERIVGEHRLFSQGLKELQDWVCEAQRVLGTCISTTTDKGVLEDRMLQLEVRAQDLLNKSIDITLFHQHSVLCVYTILPIAFYFIILP